MRSLINVVEANVDTLRETASTPKVKRQLLSNSIRSKNKRNPASNKKRKKNNVSQLKSQTKRYEKYYSPKRSEPVCCFNERIDPLVKIDTHIPYESTKTRLFSSIEEEEILNNNYPHKFNSPSHSSFSRQQRLFSPSNSRYEQSKIQSSYLKRKQSLSSLQKNKHMKNSNNFSNSKIVYLSYRNRTPDRPYQRYSKLTVSKLD